MPGFGLARIAGFGLAPSRRAKNNQNHEKTATLILVITSW